MTVLNDRSDEFSNFMLGLHAQVILLRTRIGDIHQLFLASLGILPDRPLALRRIVNVKMHLESPDKFLKGRRTVKGRQELAKERANRYVSRQLCSRGTLCEPARHLDLAQALLAVGGRKKLPGSPLPCPQPPAAGVLKKTKVLISSKRFPNFLKKKQANGTSGTCRLVQLPSEPAAKVRFDFFITVRTEVIRKARPKDYGLQ
jgi:hypothetical protein